MVRSSLGVRSCPLSHLTSQRRWKNAQHSRRKRTCCRCLWLLCSPAGLSCFIHLPRNLEEIIKDVVPRGRPELPGNPGNPSHGMNDANLWLWLSLKTPIFRLPSACPESWARPKHHSTLKPAGKSLTGERNFFSATIEENPQIIPENHDSKRAILSFSTQIRDGEASGLELQAGSWISSRFFSLPWLSSLIFPNFLGWQQRF